GSGGDPDRYVCDRADPSPRERISRGGWTGGKRRSKGSPLGIGGRRGCAHGRTGCRADPDQRKWGIWLRLRGNNGLDDGRLSRAEAETRAKAEDPDQV